MTRRRDYNLQQLAVGCWVSGCLLLGSIAQIVRNLSL